MGTLSVPAFYEPPARCAYSTPIRAARPTNARSNGARSDLPDLRDPLGLRGSLDPQDPLVQQVPRAHKARKDPSARKAQLANAVQPVLQALRARRAIPVLQAPRAIEFTVRFVR